MQARENTINTTNPLNQIVQDYLDHGNFEANLAMKILFAAQPEFEACKNINAMTQLPLEYIFDSLLNDFKFIHKSHLDQLNLLKLNSTDDVEYKEKEAELVNTYIYQLQTKLNPAIALINKLKMQAQSIRLTDEKGKSSPAQKLRHGLSRSGSGLFSKSKKNESNSSLVENKSESDSDKLNKKYPSL